MTAEPEPTKLPYLTSWRDRHGRLRYFVRRRGFKVPLRATPGTKEFERQYAEALRASRPAQRQRPTTVTGKPRSKMATRRAFRGIYFVQGLATRSIKIGFSADVLRRTQDMMWASAEPIWLIGAIDGTKADERALHERFAETRVRGEWFEPTEELVNFIRVNAKVVV